MELSHSLEDYLEAILVIESKKKIVRVRDIMEYMGYKVSSVNRALKVLSQKGLVFHEKYEYVELTQKGATIAQKIYEKHKTIFKFLNQFLKVNEKIAVKDACNVEHYLSEDSFNKLTEFIEYLEQNHNDCLKKWYKHKNYKGGNIMKLNKLDEGKEALIKKVKGEAGIRKKLLAMGIIPGERIKIEKKAPFDGAIEVKIKNYNLSLRKEEAELIYIEEV